MNVEFVTHCWRYSRLLCYQLSSFHLFAPPSVTVTICYAEDDAPTADMVRYFVWGLKGEASNGPVWNPMPMSREEVCRRAIGRNRAALASKADWLWFADCDYWFGARLFLALSTLAGIAPEHNLVYPGEIVQCSQAEGDRLIDLVTGPDVKTLCPTCDSFPTHAFWKAIGGVQIVRGEWARLNGYCKAHKRHQRPTGAWARNVEDVTFRQDMGTAGHRIKLPDVVRIRHGRRGGYGGDVLN